MIDTTLKPIHGVQYKLASRTGNLLGLITVPAPWEKILGQTGAMMFHLSGKAPWTLRDNDESQGLPAPADVRTGGLYPSYSIPGALQLEGVSIEEFELIEYCSFSPGAGYLRSLFE